MKTINIAIDGPAGAGKSSLAKGLARCLGYTYIDTGALYRSVAYEVLCRNISPNDVVKIFYEHNNPTPPLMLAIVDAARSKAIMELERFRNYMEDVIDKALHNSSCNERFYDMLFDNIDDRISYLKGEENEI